MMKNIKTYSAALLMAWTFASCSDFLDTVPDNRAEINTESQVASLLVSAYPQTYPLLIFEKLRIIQLIMVRCMVSNIRWRKMLICGMILKAM